MQNDNDFIVLNDLEMYDFYEKFSNDSSDIFGLFLEGNNTDSYSSPNPLLIKKNDVYKMYKNFNILYENNDADEQILLIDNALKILKKKLGFYDLDDLLSSNYFELETITFFEYNLSDGEPKRTRDHFKHQFRNAFFGFKLFTITGFLDKCVKCIQEEKSILSDNILNYINNISNIDQNKEMQSIITSAYFLSALFHDIGYPLAYYLRTTNSIHKYPPFFKVVNGSIKSSFSDIRAILLDSQLFKLYDNDEIEKRYNDNDHGTLSAISFLMHYYYNGRIYGHLSEKLDVKKKKIIIDWAAIAIYNHTEKYDNSRPIFSEDPVSYILRLCDDLQEWGRFSILMGDNRNLLYCNECGQLLLLKNGIYKCDCNSSYISTDKHRGYEKISKIKKKKINYISLCENMEIKVINSGEEIIIKLYYNIIAQLEMILFNYSEVVYRDKELKNVNKIITNQLLLPKIKIEYFLSNNPACLVNEFFDNYSSKIKLDEYQDRIIKLKEDCKDISIFGQQVEKDAVRYKNKSINFVENNMGLIYKLNKLFNEKP